MVFLSHFLPILVAPCQRAFPSISKEAFVLPIHKIGSKQEIEDNKPVSNLSILSKTLELVVYDQLYPAVSRCIPTGKHGFM